MNAYGYSIAKQKCEKMTSILSDVSVLLDELKQEPITQDSEEIGVAWPDFSGEMTYLANCVKHLQQGVFKIPVLGVCNAGKSTLLNALLSARVLPATALPTTAIVTSLVYGEGKDVVVYEEGKDAPSLVNWESFIHDFILSKADIDTIDAEGQIANRLNHIMYAQAECQNSLVARGVRLIDTPGLQVRISRPIVTSSFLKQSDAAVIFVLNATNPFPKEVQAFMATVLEPRRRESVFFVVNRMDQVNPSAIDMLKRNIRQMLRQHFLGENYAFDQGFYDRRVFFISAKEALEARVTSKQDNAALEASGVPALERELEEFLTGHQKFARILEPTLQILKYVVDRTCQRIAQEKAVLDEREGQDVSCSAEKERLDTLEKKLLKLAHTATLIVSGKSIVTEKLDQSESYAAVSDSDATLEQLGQVPPTMEGRRPSGNLSDEPDPWEVWIDIDDHLQFVGQVIERADIPAQVRADLRERVGQITSRRTDSNLYMAVVGEFSSGKSTFINALLRQKLLKASVLPTTTTATRICHGAALDVTVLFKDQAKPLRYLKDSAQLWQQIWAFAPERKNKDGDIREFIHLVTAEDCIASKITRVEIHHSSSFLDGIVIIDTPGTNAQSERHAQVTYELIEHEADAAVIIIPGPVPLSRTLTNFLTGKLRPYLHRCLFVVTQMDKIPEEEQTMMIEDLSARLRKALDIDHPLILYEAAPQVMLRVLNEDEVLSREIQHWKDKFSELEDVMWNRLRRERTLSIAERLVRLLNRLFEQIGTHLQERRSSYEKRQAIIKSETIQDLPRFAAEQHGQYRSTLDECIEIVWSDVTACVSKHQNQAKWQIHTTLFGAVDTKALEKVVKEEAGSILQGACQAINAELQPIMEELSFAAEQVAKSFDKRFTKEYQRLQALGGLFISTGQEVANRGASLDVAEVFSSAQKLSDDFNSKGKFMVGGGALGGALLGTILLHLIPGIGPIIGLVAGGMLMKKFGMSLDKRKAGIWEQLDPNLNAFFSSMNEQVEASFHRYASELRLALDQHIDAYIARYKTTVDEMISSQHSELEQLDRLQSAIQWDLKEIDRRRIVLKEKQQQLAVIVV